MGTYVIILTKQNKWYCKKLEWKEENNMEHEMKLQPEYYNFILNGTKRIEIRLFDEKRQ